MLPSSAYLPVHHDLQTEVTEEEAHRHHRVRNHMKERRAKKEKSKKKLEDTYQVPAIGVNLRDVGAVTRGPMREQALFRSSELLRYIGLIFAL